MFELVFTADGQRYLKWFHRQRRPGERGEWVEIGRKHQHRMEEIVRINRAQGLEVEIDDRGIYRALVLKD